MSGVQSARELGSRAEIDADVVVIGSGAGGAVAGAILAEAGRRVVILEEGPYVASDDYARMRPSQSIRHMWRDGAMTVAWGRGQSPMINVTMGRCIGGSSVLTGGVCLRPPPSVLAEWSEEIGLGDLSPKALEPLFEEVERAVHVEEVPVSMRSRGSAMFVEGAAKMGFEMKPLRRNTKNCDGCGRCNFGCPHGAKMSVDVTYLPRALHHNARVLSDCLVDRILIEGDRAVGVAARVLDERRRKRGRLRVRADRVVVAAGALHSPLLLKRAGVGRKSQLVGRNLTLHPAFRIIARFEQPIRGWRGALQSVFSDAFEHEGITMVGLFVPPSVVVATMPGFGPEHTQRAAQVPHLAIFGGLVHDRGGGVVRRGPGREPIVTYRMAAKDRAAIPTLLRLMSETFAAAGAEELYLPILGHPPVSADELKRFDFESVPAKRLECASQHPLGSCGMGTNPRRSVVDPEGRVWDLRGLYVADGSVVPTSLGVNPQLTVMTMATHIARRMAEQPMR